jgi:hypothetical protein
MSLVRGFIHNWHQSFPVLRHQNGFGILDLSALRLLAGAQPDPKMLP